MWVKICGITRLQDALLAHELGADAVGFVFAPSPRRMSWKKAAQLSSRLKDITKVGVFVNAPLEEIKEIRDRCALDIIQLHGEESPQFCQDLKGPVIKAFNFKDRSTLDGLYGYQGVWRIVLDAYVKGRRGGTGQRIENVLLREVSDFSRIILAGGLNPDNINQILPYNPFGIDLSSGLERSPGVKDEGKMRRLFEILKNHRVTTR
ncbi:phosphoribosylanthranilate isomerase [candidate division KSB1 bacterium]|nr:phosphoribosylanthranilate isomerase [candidate division KSB1 bacterium]